MTYEVYMAVYIIHILITCANRRNLNLHLLWQWRVDASNRNDRADR